MQKLGIEIPAFQLNRNLKITKNKGHIICEGVDVDGAPYSLYKEIQINYCGITSTLS